jgi:hypothetical protein
MANTFIQIGSTVTVGAGGSTTITFSSIPATYTDLCLKFSLRLRDYATLDYGFIQLNSTAGITRTLIGDGSSASAYSVGSSLRIDYVIGSGYTANTFTNGELYIPNYTSSNGKPVSLDHVLEKNETQAFQQLSAGLFSTVTSAVTSVTISGASNNFAQYSSASLYGISKS